MIWNVEGCEGDDDEVDHHPQQDLLATQLASFIVCIITVKIK